MNSVISRVPVPLCGVALAVATLGTMLEPIAPFAWPLCATVSTAFLLLILAKCAMFPHDVVDALNDPVLGGVAGTFGMLLISLSTYLARASWIGGFVLWTIGLVAFLALMVRYAVHTAIHLPIIEITPAYLVVFIGYQAASITAPVFHTEQIGYVLSIIGNVVTPVLMVLSAVRFVRHHPLKKQQTPLICILTAPFGMGLASYLTCAPQPNETIAHVLHILAFALLVIGLVAACITLTTLPFAPTFASLTFPFVISASGTMKYAALLDASGSTFASVISALSAVQLLIAVAFVTYVAIRFAVYLVKG